MNGQFLKKGRPVRLRAYQAGLWGCYIIPDGSVGSLVADNRYKTLGRRNPVLMIGDKLDLAVLKVKQSREPAYRCASRHLPFAIRLCHT